MSTSASDLNINFLLYLYVDSPNYCLLFTVYYLQKKLKNNYKKFFNIIYILYMSFIFKLSFKTYTLRNS